MNTKLVTALNLKELKQKGYTVVNDVISADDCDRYIGQYRDWLSQLKDDQWLPVQLHSITNTCNTGHLDTTWEVRLKTKRVFAEIWQTDKLLTSFDAIAIGRPPEDGKEKFQVPGKHWLHVDHGSSRVGLSVYQGGVYLEEQFEEDWTLQVMEGSHNYLDEFYRTHETPAKITEKLDHYRLKEDELDYFRDRNCILKRVPVPKGGMVLWDSRLIHANAKPIEGRANAGKWRFTVFVCMAPAIWASENDIEMKSVAYENAMMTTHWPSQRVKVYTSMVPRDMVCPETVPEIAKTDEAKMLSGVIPYDFKDGTPTGAELTPVLKSREVTKQAVPVVSKDNHESWISYLKCNIV